MTIKELFAKYSEPVIIGKGGQKTVYKVVTNDDTAYALKIISNPDDQRSIQEIKIVQALDLDNVPKIIESGKVLDEDILEEKIYVIEDFIDGETLREVLDKGIIFSLKQACELLEVLLNIEVVLENHKIIHRDIKPFPTGRYIWILELQKLLVEIHIPELQMPMDHILPGYAPHELVDNIKLDQDARVDLFAIGVTIYEVCTGHNPFRDAGAGKMDYINYLTLTYMPKPLVLKGDDNGMFSQFIEMLMAKNASERPSTAKRALEYYKAVKATLRLE